MVLTLYISILLSFAIRNAYNLLFQWDLVCDNVPFSRLPQTMFIVGQGIGALVFSILSDKFGRRPFLLLSHSVTAGVGVALAFSPNIQAFTSMKLINGVFQQVNNYDFLCYWCVWVFYLCVRACVRVHIMHDVVISFFTGDRSDIVYNVAGTVSKTASYGHSVYSIYIMVCMSSDAYSHCLHTAL